jgi:hypothetical protein
VRRRLSVVHTPEQVAPLQKYFQGETVNAVKFVIDGLKEITTFKAIADAIGYSDEFVRVRLRHDPNVVKIGRDYRIPKATAARFITELLAN